MIMVLVINVILDKLIPSDVDVKVADEKGGR
jgi:hypothetical protein